MSTPRFCSECGKPLEAGHRFCTNCGTTTSIDADARTALTSNPVVSSDQTKNAQAQDTVFADNYRGTASTIIAPNVNTPGAAVYMPISPPEKPKVPGTNVRLQISQYQHRSHLKVMGQERYPLKFHKAVLRLHC